MPWGQTDELSATPPGSGCPAQGLPRAPGLGSSEHPWAGAGALVEPRPGRETARSRWARAGGWPREKLPLYGGSCPSPADLKSIPCLPGVLSFLGLSPFCGHKKGAQQCCTHSRKTNSSQFLITRLSQRRPAFPPSRPTAGPHQSGGPAHLPTSSAPVQACPRLGERPLVLQEVPGDGLTMAQIPS